MTEDDVAKSPVFKAINLMIDQKAAELKGYMLGLQDRVERAFRKHEYPPTVRTRIHCENPRNNGDYMDMPAHVHEIKELQYYLDTIQRLEKEVNDLQRFKCRLTGDWDFTKGDLSDMIAVFGETIEGMEHEAG